MFWFFPLVFFVHKEGHEGNLVSNSTVLRIEVSVFFVKKKLVCSFPCIYACIFVHYV
jgi:hypothetical protein